MKGYGQFCPLAKASEVVGERWTPLVLRELILGARRFNQIHRGVPRMSPTLLVQRLRTLEKAGIVERRPTGDGHADYCLTEAGTELAPMLVGLAEWGKRWMPDIIDPDEADPDVAMLDLERRLNLDALPPSRTVVQFDFADRPASKRLWWLIASASGAEVCITDPGFEVDLYVTTDGATFVLMWFGDIPLGQALADGSIELHGPRELCEAFPSWLGLSTLAAIPRHRTGRPSDRTASR
jgi:DNA-binding HxlR family transcriptional regulator